MKFKEYCVILEDESLHNSEIMLHINEDGKIIRTYGYLDNIPEFYDYDKYDRYGEFKRINFPFTFCENKLFVNFKISQIIKYLNSIYFCEQDVKDFEDYDDSVLQKAVIKYKDLQVI